MKRSLHSRWSSIAVNVALAALVVGPVYAASSIGTNLSTGGTLTVTGASTLTGAVTATGGVASGANMTVPAAYALDVASAGVLNLGTTTATTVNIGRSGQTQALLGNATVAGTLGVTGASTFTGNLGIATTTPGTPLGVTGAGVFTGPLTFTWLNATSTTATSTFSTGGLTAGTNQFVIQQNSGNIGIGTSTPSQLFSVHGNTYISGTSYFGGAITATSTLTLSATSTHTGIVNALGVVGAPSFAFSGNLNTGIWSSAANTINFSTNGSERMRIDSNGNLGIGTTTPGTPLGVTGAAVITGAVTAPSFVATSTTASTTLSTGGLAVGANQFIVQQNSGKVALGTTSPYANFSIQSGTGTVNTDAFIVATSSGAAVFGIDNDGHRFTSGPTPVLSSCGTSPSIAGDDSGGTVTNGTSGGGACTLTFAKAYRYTPYCNVNTGANTASSSVTSISTSAVTFSIVPNVDSIKLYYSCAYHQ